MCDVKLLKNKQEFEEWKKNNIFRGNGDVADEPEEYPCYVTKNVIIWDEIYQYEVSVYLYRTDIEKMLISLLPPNATVKISTP